MLSEIQKTYTCPMHLEVTSNTPGTCSKCGMDLSEVGAAATVPTITQNPPSSKKSLKTFLPLIIIFGLLSAVSLIQVYTIRKIALDGFTPTPLVTFSSGLQIFMSSFMGGFFLIFGGFKLLDIKGFAHGFQTYDVIAKRTPSYGLIYPFIELALGFAFLLRIATVPASIVALAISLIGLVGVGIKLRKKEIIQSVCLGTVFDLPLTNITLFENLIMAVMAIGMLTL